MQTIALTFDEITDGTRVIQTWRQNQEQVIQQHRFEFQVEIDRFVIQFDVRHFADDVLIVILTPSFGWMSHHR